LSQLYPNDYSGDNRVLVGQITAVPPREAKWALEAIEPVGKSIVAFIVTIDDMHPDHILDFGGPNEALHVVDPTGPWAIDRLVVNVSAD
jgi:hypothetical protein